MLNSRIYRGGCHCGAVRFQVTVDRQKVINCNCSICRKKSFLHLIVDRDRFQLLQGEDCLTTYTFNTHTAKHLFCRICGIHSFYHPRSHPGSIDVNVRCLDEDILSEFESEFFDGANWEKNIDKLN
jgi:hypothetical protein